MGEQGAHDAHPRTRCGASDRLAYKDYWYTIRAGPHLSFSGTRHLSLRYPRGARVRSPAVPDSAHVPAHAFFWAWKARAWGERSATPQIAPQGSCVPLYRVVRLIARVDAFVSFRRWAL